MDATPESFAYRCLPLNIANAHGWELLSPCGFEAEWTGGAGVDDVVVRTDPGTDPAQAPVALFGQGVLTFHVEGLLRTPPGFGLWVGGSPNDAKDGLSPLSGLIETDWSPYSFTMNWRFTRPRHRVRFEENEPFCFFFPVERALVEAARPRIAALDENPVLKRQFTEWSASRDRFQAEVAANPPQAPADKWQKLYYRGVDAFGAPGGCDHRAKLRLAEFAGADAFHRTASPSCPVKHALGAPSAAPAVGAAPSVKLEWLMTTLERLRALSPAAVIPRLRGLSAEAFRDCHYATNWPVVIEGALKGWPALDRWTPEYLKSVIGDRPVQVQVARTSDPDYERLKDEHVAMMPFDQFIDRINRPGAGNEAYLTAYNAPANAKALAPLHADLGFLEDYLTREVADPHGMMWIGPAGTFTPLHHDLTNNLLLQLVGRKQVLLAAPGETPRLYNDRHVFSRIRDLTEPGVVETYPKLNGLRVHRVRMQPGDALFIPLGWWHQVIGLDFSVSITHTNFRWPNDFHADYPFDS
jgi:hypothetical protein